MEEDQKDQLLVEVLQKQTRVLQTMQSTIQKFVTSLDAAKKVDQGYAETLKSCIEQEHGQLPGLQKDYELINDEEGSAQDKLSAAAHTLKEVTPIVVKSNIRAQSFLDISPIALGLVQKPAEKEEEKQRENVFVVLSKNTKSEMNLRKKSEIDIEELSLTP